jgi:hypothetical protein
MAAKTKQISVAMHVALSKTKIEALLLFGREMKNRIWVYKVVSVSIF